MVYIFDFPAGTTLPSGHQGFFLCFGKGLLHLQVTVGPDHDIIVTEHVECCGHSPFGPQPLPVDLLPEPELCQKIREAAPWAAEFLATSEAKA